MRWLKLIQQVDSYKPTLKGGVPWYEGNGDVMLEIDSTIVEE